MSISEVLIYAELLSNIRQISIVVILPTPSTDTTTSELSSDGRQFSLLHQGQRTTIQLPGQVAAHAPQVDRSPLGRTDLSWRLPAVNQVSSQHEFRDSSAEAPWTAKDLCPGAEVVCRECDSIILEPGKLKSWKDLPSENWAEMMEFWHCHKPDVEPAQTAVSSDDTQVAHSHDNEDPNSHRGYGANSKFIATEGVGFVDLSTFLLTETDVKNITSHPPSSNKTSSHIPISCTLCTTTLGHHDPLASGLRLYKWRLKLPPSSPLPSNNPSTPPTLSEIAIHTTTFASTMHAQATSRLLLSPLSQSPSPSPPSQKTQPTQIPSHLNLWILTPSIHYSSSLSSSSSPALTTTTPQHAMKIFYRVPSLIELRDLQQKDGVEEIFLPAESIETIWRALVQSRRVLPKASWTFKEWDVGLLERY